MCGWARRPRRRSVGHGGCGGLRRPRRRRAAPTCGGFGARWWRLRRTVTRAVATRGQRAAFPALDPLGIGTNHLLLYVVTDLRRWLHPTAPTFARPATTTPVAIAPSDFRLYTRALRSTPPGPHPIRRKSVRIVG
jgi:hypothetical protein